VAGGACGVLPPIEIIYKFYDLNEIIEFINNFNRRKHAAGATSHKGEARSRLFTKDLKIKELESKLSIKSINTTDLPENHNICIKNFRTKIAKVYNGKEWKTMDDYERQLEDWAEDEET
jgi:hypothetical protein